VDADRTLPAVGQRGASTLLDHIEAELDRDRDVTAGRPEAGALAATC
jgi:hypothetical protein